MTVAGRRAVMDVDSHVMEVDGWLDHDAIDGVHAGNMRELLSGSAVTTA